MITGYHSSVLLKEAIDALIPNRLRQDGLALADNWYLDCTLGDGGHSLEIIKRGGRVVGIDVDPEALERAKRRLGNLGYSGNFRLIQGNFRDLKKLIQQMDLADQKFSAAIFDLGVSSLQLETPKRGFSFSRMGPLDMRMDPSLEVRALDLINAGGRKELYELFKNLGEEKYSWRLADSIVSSREVEEATGSRQQAVGIKTTKELANLIERTVGRKGKIHPATKVFQALRIAVNDELASLHEGLNQVIDLIKKDGLILVISFHSLEDRIVKNTFKEWEDRRLGEVVTKKPIVPTNQEIAENPRSRSAKLRVFRKKYDHY